MRASSRGARCCEAQAVKSLRDGVHVCVLLAPLPMLAADLGSVYIFCATHLSLAEALFSWRFLSWAKSHLILDKILGVALSTTAAAALLCGYRPRGSEEVGAEWFLLLVACHLSLVTCNV